MNWLQKLDTRSNAYLGRLYHDSMHTSKDVIRHVGERLRSLGFRKEKFDVFSMPVSDHVFGWLGLNKATKWGLEINPVVGARHQPTERIVAECAESPFDRIIPATVAANIGYIAPQQKYMPFLFSEASSLTEVTDQMVGTISAYGVPFMKDCADLNFIVDFMQAGGALNSSVEYRIPVGLHLLGRDSEADAYLQKRLEQIADQTNAYAIYYRRFSANLKRRLKAGVTSSPMSG